MFKITPLQSEDEIRECARACGATEKPGYFAYAMRDLTDLSLMGFAQFDILGDDAVLADLKPVPSLDDFEAMFILGRQTLNFMEKCGAERVSASKDAAEIVLLKAIGFKEDDDKIYKMNIKGLFDGHCSSCK